MIRILDKNPFFTTGDGPTTKLIIGDVQISVASSEIETALKKQDVGIRSPIKDKTYRNGNGQLTRFKTGGRFVYIDLPVSSLPKYIRIDIDLPVSSLPKYIRIGIDLPVSPLPKYIRIGIDLPVSHYPNT